MSRPFIPAPNTASVEMIYSQAGQVIENAFHVAKGSSYSLSDLQAVRNVVINWFNVTFKPGVANNVTLVRVRTKALDTNTSPMEDYSLPSPIAGTNGSTPLPPNATYCLKLATGLSGRSARGRFYVVGLTSAQMATVVDVTTGFSSFCVSSLNTLITNLSTAGSTFVITSFRHDKNWRTTAVNYTVTGAVAVDLHIDSQRRRLAGRGRS